MKRRSFIFRSSFAIGMVVGLLLLAACEGPSTPPVTPQPTATATPRSIPIPPVPTDVPLAIEENPLTILLLPQGTRRATAGADEELETLIFDLAGLTVNVEIANSYSEIVAQLCGPTPVVGWLDGLSFIVAEAQRCADPTLRVVRDRATGYTVEMLMAVDFAGDEVSADDLARLAGQTVCRVDSEDDVSWFVPSLMLYASGVNPVYDLDEIIDVEDYDALITAIYNGDCRAGAVPEGYFENEIGAELRALEDLTEEVAVVSTSPEIPYDILVYPQIVPLNVRIPLDDVFVQIAADADHAGVLESILQQDSLRRVDREDFEELRAFMLATGLNFAALGE